MASEETPRGLTGGCTRAPREEAGPDGQLVWRGTTGRRPEANWRRKPGKVRRPAGAWSAKLWGNWRPGPVPRGRTRSLTGGPERRSVSRVRPSVGIGGQSPREELLRLEERPRIRIGLRDPDRVGSD